MATQPDSSWLTAASVWSFAAPLVAGFITAHLSVRFALKKFRSEKCYERKQAQYDRIVNALQSCINYCSACSHDDLTGNVTDDAEMKILATKAKDGRQELTNATNVGNYVISDEAAEILLKLENRKMTNPDDRARFEFYDEECEVYKKAIAEITRLAKKDLETT